ncbi:MAG TPA: 50S ribosomal protein L29 [Bacteroidales bacterium]|nr:50S ribosomal protein L29 [Bacteroidales bacterium]
MKTAEIRELTTKEIEERIDTEKALLNKMRLNHAISPLDNPNKIVASKRNIARMKTELRQRELNETSQSDK